MRHDPKVAMLRAIELFADLRTKELREVSRMCTAVDVPAGTALTTQDRMGFECFIVVSGWVDVVVDGQVIVTLGPGEVLGEISLLEGVRRTATVVASSPVRALVLSVQEFFSLTGRFPAVAGTLASVAVRRLNAPAMLATAGC